MSTQTPWRKRVQHSLSFPLRAARHGARLPPGSLQPCQDRIASNQRYFLDRAAELGPVFKATMAGLYTTCVVGHERGARLVSAHNQWLPGVTINLEPLFPKGALRGMSGELHKHYRRVFLHALHATPLDAHAGAVDVDVTRTLQELASASEPPSGDLLRDALRRLTTGIMMRFLFGVSPGTPRFVELERAYRRFGPHAPVYKVHAEHAEAFLAITAVLGSLAREVASGAPGPACLLRHMVRSGELDETSRGNLAYMFEPSHFDLYSLWHWILRNLGTNPGVAAEYHRRADPAARRQYAAAIVQESLRTEQSELLYRRVMKDIVFEGFLLPRGTTLRVCIWEGHHDGDVFPRPFEFDPSRFDGVAHGLDTYAPFGLGPRHCLGAPLVLGLSAIFLERLLGGYDVHLTADGPPHLGAFHWQPSPQMAVRLVPHAAPPRAAVDASSSSSRG